MCVHANSTGYQMASCAAQLPSLRREGGGGPFTQRARTQGHCCVCPETRLLSRGNMKDKDPSSPGGCRGTPGACVALLQPRLERPMILSARCVYTQTHKNTRIQPTEQPVFRAPQDYCFDSQGEKIVIERTSDTCVVARWRAHTGHTHKHTSQSKVDVITMD